MSDSEGLGPCTTPSICSDPDLEAAPALRSLSSIDFVQQKGSRQKGYMSGGGGYKGFLPGHQRPPHHRAFGTSGSQEGSGPPSPMPPVKPEQPTHQWSFDMSEPQSGDAVSPRKEIDDIPSFSVDSGPKLEAGESATVYDDMQKQSMSGREPIVEDGTPLDNTKRSRSKDRKKKKSHRGKRSESENGTTQDGAKIFSQETEGTDSTAKYVSQGFRNRKQSKKREASHSTRTDSNISHTAVENPSFEDSEKFSSVTWKKGEMQQSFNSATSKDIYGVPTSSGDLGWGDNQKDHAEPERNMYGENEEADAQHRSCDTPSQTHRPLHSAVLQPLSNMSSETRRNINQNYTAMYIYNNIKQRECCVYARDKKSDRNNCQCGRDVQWHMDKGIPVNIGTHHNFWHPRDHTEVMPCDSFGEILFRGFGSQSYNSPYMRVDSVCDMDKVWTVLTECWQLPVPKLLISVTGGAKRFNLRPRLKTILKQGLVNAAVSTGAWIITGGTATGVMELVGEAVHDHIQVSGDSGLNECVALGIASWGIVANNIALDGEGEHGLFPASYCMEDIKTEGGRGGAYLDHNHTHFLLVDDGSEGKFGVEIKFRSKLESYISQKVETGVTETQSVNVPSVQIVVEGGINTMKSVRESITRNIPIVVVDGSGRAADFIAMAFRLTKNSNEEDRTVYPPDFEDTMIKKARVMFEWKKSMSAEDIDKNIHEALHYLENCLEQRKLLNIFNLDKADSVKDIDRAILYALLKANKSNCNSQLSLALAWNRCDIARQEIFTAENRHSWQQADLYNAMFTALVQDRADFVQLFLDNGVDLKRFLTTRTLWNLYCNCIVDQTSAEASLLRYLISYLKVSETKYRQTWAAFLMCRGTPNFENFPDLLPFINKVIVHLLQDQSFIFYTDKHVVENETPTMTWKGDIKKVQPMSVRIDSHKSVDELGKISRRRTKHHLQDKIDFEYPERDIFIWAVLFNRRNLAHLFWKTGRDHLGGSLFASALLYRLSELADGEEEAELSRDMYSHSDEWERLAVSVLSECYTRDKLLTHRLLVRDLVHWGGATLFKIAESYELMEFAEHSACQTKLSSIWKGRMALYTSEMKIFVCTFLPIFVPFIKFTIDSKEDNEEEENEFFHEQETGSADGKLVSPGRSFPHKNQVGPNALPDTDGDGLGFVRSKTRRKGKSVMNKVKQVKLFNFTGNLNIFYAIYYFYQAPVTKFFCNIVSYMIFTGLFSYFVLVKLGPTSEEDSPSMTEYMTWGWLCTMIMEEVRQLFIGDQHSLKYKFRSWYGNVWNRFDAAMYVLFIVSIILRYQLSEENFVGARITYSITLAMFFLRFMQFFYVEKNMGPKVIMIRKMLTDLMFFFLILLVFVVSFGVAYHANMFPQAPPSWSILANVLYFPYFQMYGELFLQDLRGEPEDPCTDNETIWRDDPFQRCPTQSAVVPILLAVYMVLTNILLVNLLIAMFSYTFQTVQDNSLQVWRFYRLSLVFEYFDRPTLVPPIIVINHMFRLGRWVVYRCTGKGKRHNSFKLKPTPEEQNRLTMFEKSAMEHYLSVSKQQSKLTLDSRVKNTSERLDLVMEELEVIKESLQQQENTRTSMVLPGTVMQDTSGPGNNLQRERELLERPPLSSAVSENKSKLQTRERSQEMESLRKTVDEVVAQSSSMSERLSQIMRLLETSISEQQLLLRSHRSREMALDVTEIEEGNGSGSA